MPRLVCTVLVGASVLGGVAFAVHAAAGRRADHHLDHVELGAAVASSDQGRPGRSGPSRSRRRPTAASNSRCCPRPRRPPPGTFDAVRDGLVDVSYVTASYTPARHVLPLLPELPGGGATAEINSVAYSRIHWKYLQPGRRVQGREAARRLHAWAGPDVQHQAADHQGRGPCRHENPLRRRHLRGNGACARRLGLRQAGARILRAAELRRRRRHVLPAGIRSSPSSSARWSSTPRCFPAASTAPRSASS